jgi:hypothetical protein
MRLIEVDRYAILCWILTVWFLLRTSSLPAQRLPNYLAAAPSFGCTFGGWLYDFLIYPGESPVNTPWVGLKRIVRPDWKAVKAELTGKDPEKVVV